MLEAFAYSYDVARLFWLRPDVLKPALDAFVALGFSALLCGGYLWFVSSGLPFLHYRAEILREASERARKLAMAQELILKKEIQAELEEEMREELAREAAMRMAIGAR